MMASAYGGFTGLADEIARLDFVSAEAKNVVNASTRQVSEDFLASISDPSVWPVYMPPHLPPNFSSRSLCVNASTAGPMWCALHLLKSNIPN